MDILKDVLIHEWLQLILLVGMIFCIVRQVRFWIRKSKSGEWPAVFATIGNTKVFFSGITYGHYCQLDYEYNVAGSCYAGRFALVGALKADKSTWRNLGENAAVDLAREWTGRQIRVRYNPSDPKISILEDNQLSGRTVFQGPDMLGPTG